MDYNSHSSSRGGGPGEGYPSPADRRPTASSSSHSSSQAYSHPTLPTQPSYSSNNLPPNDQPYQPSPYGSSSYRNQPKLSIHPSSPESGPHSAPPRSSASNLPPPVSVPPRSATSPSPSSRLSNPPPPSSSNRQGEGESSRWNSRPSSEDAQDDDHGLAYLGRERRTSYADGASSGSESQYSGSARGAEGGEDGRGMSSSSRARQAGAGPSSSSIDPSYSSHSHSYGLPVPASRSGTPSSTYDGPRPPSTAPSSPPSAHSHAAYPSPPQPHYHPPQSSNSLQSPTQQPSNPYSLGSVNSSSALSHTSSAYAGSASSHQSQSHQSTQAVWPGSQPPQQPQPQTICASCGHPVTGPFVRALKTVYHLDCFRCQDCNKVVAAKFFPIESKDGKQYPLCETDYFRRLDLICSSCGMALRGSYITACQKKFHVEHFTCSACPTLFGPQDSYYEHNGDVFCHFHYSTRFATKCVGCGVAILKQFVEINRNQQDECWHPECYMIQKFWNVKLLSRFAASTHGSPAGSISNGSQLLSEEQSETAETLKAKQQEMEQQVYRVWTVLSAFEESSAACISEMLSHVSNSLYMEAVNMAERFIFHVEVLFATIDELETHFIAVNAKGMSHVREAKLLCRTTVNFFSLLAHTHETGARRTTGITADLLSLVTRLAHYLKILIRISLTGALKLEREHADRSALGGFLDRLSLLARDGGDPGARRRRVLKQRAQAELAGVPPPEEKVGGPSSSSPFAFDRYNYGYKSLFLVDGESLLRGDSGSGEVPLDLCVSCAKPVEEDCIRLGTFPHWHSYCVKCKTCGRPAAPYIKEEKKSSTAIDEPKPVKAAPVRKPRPDVDQFVYLPRRNDQPPTTAALAAVPEAIFCLEHALEATLHGFETVTRLEQFAFLLNAALRRLYSHLRAQGVVAAVPSAVTEPSSEEAIATSMYDAYKDSNDVKRMKSVNLDRKLSSTTAHVPKRSTVVESPSGKVAKSSVPVPPPSTSNKVLPTVPPLPTVQSHSASVHSPQPVRPVSGAFSPRPSSQFIPPSSFSNISRDDSPLGGVSTTSSSNHDPDAPQTTITSVLRPSFARNNTSVRIVSEPSPDIPFDRGAMSIAQVENQYDDHLTLGDFPGIGIVEAVEARVEHRPFHSERRLVADLSPVESLIIKYFAVLQLQKSPLAETFDLDEILELVSKKKDFWNKLFKAGKKEKEIKKKGVFAVPLDQLVERAGSDSVLGATDAHLKVPTFVEDIIAAMKQMDMSVEGIFRKNGNIRRLKDMCDALDRDPSTVNLTDENPVQLAALLKKFLRDMPDPLLTFRLHRLFCQSQTLPTEAERRRYLHLIVCLLPRCNRDTMEIVFVFLKWVASFSHIDEETGSKMDLQNLSTVITPSILYSKGGNPLRDESFVAIKAVTLLLQAQDDFYTVPDELDRFLIPQVIDLFERNLEQPPKEMLKSCSKYHVQFQNHRRAQGRTQPQPPLQPPPNRGQNDQQQQRMPSYRSDQNLSQTASGNAYDPNQSQGRPISQAGQQSRPVSWAQTQQQQQQQSYDGHSNGGGGGNPNPNFPRPINPHQPFSQTSVSSHSHSHGGADSPLSPRRGFPGGASLPLTSSSSSDQHDPRRSYYPHQPPQHANTHPQPTSLNPPPLPSDPQRS